MLDVHIIRRPEIPHDTWERCWESVRASRAKVRVITPQGENHIGLGRMEGFARGSNPFVTYVDDDDMVTPGLLDALVDFLTQHPKTMLLHVYHTVASKAEPLKEPLQAPPLFRPVRPRAATSFHDHMNVFRRDHLQHFLPLYRDCPRGGDWKVLQAYVRSLGFDAEVYYTPGKYYFWCGR